MYKNARFGARVTRSLSELPRLCETTCQTGHGSARADRAPVRAARLGREHLNCKSAGAACLKDVDLPRPRLPVSGGLNNMWPRREFQSHLKVEVEA